jgi:flavin-dependent dehydrogenase
MKTIDLVIIGSGPAGISTALHLLQHDAGWAERLVVIEKARHPRPKLCGGAVTRLGLNVLSGLGFPRDLPLPKAWVEQVRFVYRGRTIHVRGRPQLQVFHRAELDAYMAGQACRRGVNLRQDETVKRLAFDKDGVTVETSRGILRARAVVGGDGSKGISRRYVTGNRQPAHVARLLESLVPVAPDMAIFRQGYAEFNFTPAEDDLQGYAWDFPAFVGGRPHSNRGVYDARLSRARRRADLPAILETWLAGRGQPDERRGFAGHPIHWFSPRGPFARPRLLLAGDAAGAEPLFGEGIAPALVYGRLAAEAVQDAFSRGDFAFRDYPRRILTSELGQYLLARWLVAQAGYRLSDQRWFMEMMWFLGKLANAVIGPPPPLEKAERSEIQAALESCRE